MTGIRDALQDTLDNLEARYGQNSDLVGVPTGYTEIDSILHGLQASTLTILAARPGMGKTSLALGMARNVATETGRPVVFFGLEMGTLELTKRLLAIEARVDATKIWTGRLSEDDWSRLSHAVGRLADAQLFLDDNPHCTLMEVRAKARRMRARHGDLALVVIDYIQLMTPSSGKRAENRQVEVSEISRGLKILARELECPVVALAQLNRQVEYRQDKRPMLADLRESGGLEQDADVVAFIYRDDVYNPDSDDRGKAEIIVAKHRNGPTGRADLAFLPRLASFENMARD
jgi:replicative DNA helicase